MIGVRQSPSSIAMKLTSIDISGDAISSTRMTLFMLGSDVEASVAKAFKPCSCLGGSL